jgi:hypothetical protein
MQKDMGGDEYNHQILRTRFRKDTEVGVIKQET